MAAAKRKPDVKSAMPTRTVVVDIALSLAGPDATPRPSPPLELRSALEASLANVQPRRWSQRRSIALAVGASAALWAIIAAAILAALKLIA
jgi:hypothetical protein